MQTMYELLGITKKWTRKSQNSGKTHKNNNQSSVEKGRFKNPKIRR